MFEQIKKLPPDPILGLIALYRDDPNPDKVDLGVGVYQDENGMTPVLDCVHKAEAILWQRENSKAYLGPPGVAGYNSHASCLLLGNNHPAIAEKRVATVQTPGGTGALRVAAEFVHRARESATVWLPDPTWPNHTALFPGAGLRIKTYRYRDAASNSLDVEGMFEDLAALGAGDVLVLHGCCHNPSGIDLSADQWRRVAELAAETGCLPLVDFAYQGFAEGLEEDAQGLRTLVSLVPEVLVTSSASKNFGLYRERCGAISLITPDAQRTAAGETIIHNITRGLYSMPPTHGPAIVEIILDSEELTLLWHRELADMRNRINGQRRLFVDKLQAAGVKRDFSFVADQYGMFSLLGVSDAERDRLRDEFSIYIVGDTRFNVAGLRDNNIDYVVSAMVTTLGEN